MMCSVSDCHAAERNIRESIRTPASSSSHLTMPPTTDGLSLRPMF